MGNLISTKEMGMGMGMVNNYSSSLEEPYAAKSEALALVFEELDVDVDC